jgi:hypothetical protein
MLDQKVSHVAKFNIHTIDVFGNLIYRITCNYNIYLHYFTQYKIYCRKISLRRRRLGYSSSIGNTARLQWHIHALFWYKCLNQLCNNSHRSWQRMVVDDYDKKKWLLLSIRSSLASLFYVFNHREAHKQYQYLLVRVVKTFRSSFICICFIVSLFKHVITIFALILSCNNFLWADQWTESCTGAYVCLWREVLQWSVLGKIFRSSKLERWQV